MKVGRRVWSVASIECIYVNACVHVMILRGGVSMSAMLCTVYACVDTMNRGCDGEEHTVCSSACSWLIP